MDPWEHGKQLRKTGGDSATAETTKTPSIFLSLFLLYLLRPLHCVGKAGERWGKSNRRGKGAKLQIVILTYLFSTSFLAVIFQLSLSLFPFLPAVTPSTAPRDLNEHTQKAFNSSVSVATTCGEKR